MSSAPLIPPNQYAPGSKSANLGLALDGLTTHEANAVVAIDAVLGLTPVVPTGLQKVGATTPLSVSKLVALTTLYSASIYLYSPGLGTGTLTATLSWNEPLDGSIHTMTFSVSGSVSGVVLETVPLFVPAGSTISISTAYSGVAFPYDISASLTIFPQPA